MKTETDKELLEFAAKAEGIVGLRYIENKAVQGAVRSGMWCDLNETLWNPLTDDGDALRLIVGIGLFVHCENDMNRTQCGMGPLPGLKSVNHGRDCYAATRRAIVRAAAEIGRAMP